MVLAGDLVPASTTLVTPAVKFLVWENTTCKELQPLELTNKLTTEFTYNGTSRGLHKERYWRIDNLTLPSNWNACKRCHRDQTKCNVMGELTLQTKPLSTNSTLYITGPIRIRQKSYFQGKLFIFRANCYFQGKFLRPPSKMPSRRLMPLSSALWRHRTQSTVLRPLRENGLYDTNDTLQTSR